MGNTATNGGVFHVEFCQPGPVITNCTLVNNIATYGGAVYACTPSGSPITIKNSILWSNTASIAGQQIYAYFAAGPSASYSLLQGEDDCVEFGLGGYFYDNGYNSGADPQFMNASDPDGSDDLFGTVDDGLQLQADSPCTVSYTHLTLPTKRIV